jgi:hypothetical protein
MLLDAVKETIRSSITILFGALFGLIGSAVYLFSDKFRCFTENISIKASLNVNKLNITEIIHIISSGIGKIDLPVDTDIRENVSQCTAPIVTGTAIGVGLSAIGLSAYYAHRCFQSKQRLTFDKRINSSVAEGMHELISPRSRSPEL